MIYLGLLAITGVIIYFYWQTMPQISKAKRWLLAALRFIALSIVILLLFNPVIRYSRKLPFYPQIMLLLDNSISMDERSGDTTKKEIFSSIAQNVLNTLNDKGYDARIMEFADGLDGDRDASRLSSTLAEVNQQYPDIDQFFLFSDGWFDDSDHEFIQNIQLPVNAVQTDFSATGFDLQISEVKYNQRAWLKELNSFIVDVNAQNYQGNAEVEFYLSDQKIASKNIDFSRENYQQLLFEHEFSQTGLQQLNFVVKTDSLLELQKENNQYPGAVLVLEDKSEIVVISDKITWEGRFLIQSAQINQRFNTRYLNKQNQLFHQREVTDLASQMQNCRVLCLINYGKLEFNNNEKQIIERFLNNGGGLLFMGKPSLSLQSLLPAQMSNINRTFEGKFLLNKTSEQYQSFQVMQDNIEEIPPVRFHYTKPKLSALNLAVFTVDQNPPAVLYQEYGNGKVLYFSFVDLWKWQLWGKDDNYKLFTGNILQWLSFPRSQNFFAYSEQNSYLMGDQVNIKLAAFDEKFAPLVNLKAQISIFKDNQQIINDYLLRKDDQYYYNFAPDAAGKYSFTVEDKLRQQKSEGDFIIMPANSEVRDRGINNSLLSYLTQQTGGNYFADTSSIDNYPQATVNYKTNYYEIPIYKKWYTITLFLLAFSIEIFLRKRWGLL